MSDEDQLHKLSAEKRLIEDALVSLTDILVRGESVKPFGIPDELLPHAVFETAYLLVLGATRESLVTESANAFGRPTSSMRPFVDAVSRTVTSTVIVAPQGVAKLQTPESFAHSQAGRSNQLLEILMACGEAYEARDFALVGRFSEIGLLTFPYFPLFQLHIVSLERQQRLRDAETCGQRAANILKYQPPLMRLLNVTLGREDPARLLKAAETADWRCVVHYYQGARALTKGHVDKARAAFLECQRCDSQIFERSLAMADLRALDS